MNKLSVKKISKSYNSSQVVSNVSIEVNTGEIIGLLGPNGAGKTTCFYMITGLIQPESGSIHLDKKNINFPITIRRWIRGDYIYPTGMKGKKLISKIFKDKKLSKYEKEEQLVVEDCDHILWLVGIRFDKRKYNEQNLNFKISKIDK